ncbi:MAG: LysM domain-containing protein [Dialister sp.]|nr:LysM domain-containing protein [Dialister sp.]
MNKALMMTAVLAAATIGAGAAVNGSLVHDYFFAGRNELIEYRKEIKSGDTLWDICREIATDREDLRKLVWQAKKDNRIKDVGNLQPGMLIVVKVKEARNG